MEFTNNCRHSIHIFQFSSNNTNDVPHDGTTCDCGMYEYQEGELKQCEVIIWPQVEPGKRES